MWRYMTMYTLYIDFDDNASETIDMDHLCGQVDSVTVWWAGQWFDTLATFSERR